MDPNQQPASANPGPNQTVQPNEPLFHGPFQDPTQTPPQPQQPTPPNGGQSPVAGPGKPKNKAMILLLVVGGLLVLVIIVAVIIAASSSNKPKATTQQNNSSASDSSKGPQPATNTSIQLINDSISDDISGLSEDKDFPKDKLEDQPLGL